MAQGSAPGGGITLADRILAIVSRRGDYGIAGDELLRSLGVAYDDLMASLNELQSRGLVRVEWPTPEGFRVMPVR